MYVSRVRYILCITFRSYVIFQIFKSFFTVESQCPLTCSERSMILMQLFCGHPVFDITTKKYSNQSTIIWWTTCSSAYNVFFLGDGNIQITDKIIKIKICDINFILNTANIHYVKVGLQEPLNIIHRKDFRNNKNEIFILTYIYLKVVT